MIVQFIIAAVLIAAGVFVFITATIGVFRYKYILNRMHVAAQCDTMGALLCVAGCMVLTGISFTTLKLLLVIAFIWAASPLCAHLIAKAEYVSQDPEDEDAFEEEVLK